ncbi:MAG: glycosyltransferase family 4 protein [Pseudomonadota bacterium]
MSACRLAVVISHPIQHFAPLYQEINRSEAVEIKVFFLAENGVTEFRDQQFAEDFKWDIPLLDGYEHQFLEPGKIIEKFTFLTMDSNKLVPALKAFRPDLIWLHGYAQLANLRVVLSSLRHQPIIYSSDSNLADARAWWRATLKRWYIRFFFSHCRYFLSISPSNRAYLAHFGVVKDKIVDTRFPVDIQRLSQDRDKLPAGSKQQLRAQLNIPEDARVLLFAGKLIEHKGPQLLLQAMSKLSQPAVALFVGSGELLPSLEATARQQQLTDRVRFIGFVNQRELAAYYDLADVFVFPSLKEPYGAVAAEVLPFALPMVVADSIGAIGASIIKGKNALLFATGQADRLANTLDGLLSDDTKMRSFSAASAKLAMDHDKSVMARDIIKICSKYT